MVLGKRGSNQQELIVATTSLPRSPGHPFYKKLNELLLSAGFDAHVESLCERFYAGRLGRPSIPPGIYFRMLFIGYFEGIGSQRGIAWRCADSRSLQEFLGLKATDRTPDHSSLTVIRKRLPTEVHEEVFAFVLKIASDRGILKGKTIAVDATTLEANAAMKSIVRRDTGADWNEYVRQLAAEAGIEDPSDEDLRRFDRKRKGKKVSNKDWRSPTDPDSRIAKMKDGRTQLAYKAEHAVDVESEIVIAGKIYHADQPDGDTGPETVTEAQVMIEAIEHEQGVEEAVADKGYHKTAFLAWLQARQIRSYIPERRDSRKRRWTDKPEDWLVAFRNNRRRVRGDRSKALQKLRSERVERSFAHSCESGGARRSWLTGLLDIGKRYVIHLAAMNLGTIVRAAIGVGTPREFADRMAAAAYTVFDAISRLWALLSAVVSPSARNRFPDPDARTAVLNGRLPFAQVTLGILRLRNAPSSTAC